MINFLALSKRRSVESEQLYMSTRVDIVALGLIACLLPVAMGFTEDDVVKALRISRNDVNVAMDILMSYS
jgi:uncharacterized UBP type Zn finger protein